MPRTRTTVLALVASLCCLAACEQKKLDQATYDQVKVGMTYEQVKGVLGGDGEDQTTTGVGIGSGGVASGGTASEKIYVWKDGNKSIAVNIKDGKVTNVTKFGF